MIRILRKIFRIRDKRTQTVSQKLFGTILQGHSYKDYFLKSEEDRLNGR